MKCGQVKYMMAAAGASWGWGQRGPYAAIQPAAPAGSRMLPTIQWAAGSVGC